LLALKSLFYEQVLQRVISGVENFGFKCQGWIQSPITGAEGNIEFLACFHRLPSSTASSSIDMNENTHSDDTIEHDETQLS
jgi:23S rRNA (cytidine1920-2'-O)/16S rRNA (cytidine1409-2'-O)-methyltransferase